MSGDRYEEFSKRVLADLADICGLDVSYLQVTNELRAPGPAVSTSDTTVDVIAEFETEMKRFTDPVTIKKTYPPDVAIERKYLQAVLKTHIDRVREECKALPAHLASLRIDRAWRYELAHIIAALLRCETRAMLHLIISRGLADQFQIQRKSPPA